jgi:hypothetical protein
VKAYFDNYLGQHKDTVGPLMGKRGLQYVITDSWEAGVQNWTDDMIAEFAKHRGYDMRPWISVLAGHIVESAAASSWMPASAWQTRRRSFRGVRVFYPLFLLGQERYAVGCTTFSQKT